MSHQQPPAMNPEALPQQRLYEVKKLPDFKGRGVRINVPIGTNGIAKKKPASAVFLCQAEWSWSPVHHRIENYHISLNTKRDKWVLWVSYYDDWGWPWTWEPYEDVWTCDYRHSNRHEASLYLLHSYWACARLDDSIDEFHWIGAEGLLGISELRALGSLIWDSNEN